MKRLLVLIFVASLPGIASGQTGVLQGDLRRAAQRVEPSEPRGDDATQQAADRAAAAYREGRLGEAVDGYDRAAAEAYRSGAPGRAFESALAAAELQRSQREYADASARFRRAALGAVNDPRAVAAHYTACGALGALVDGGRPAEELIERYDALLAEHAATWPATPTAAEAAWRRVELLAKRGDWAALIERLRPIRPGDPRHARSRELLVEAYGGLLASGDSFERRLAEATEDLEPILFGANRRWPERWTPLQQAAALTLARGHLRRGAEGAGYAASVLRIALRDDSLRDPAWRSRARAAETVALLATGDLPSAEASLDEVHAGSVDEARTLLRAVAERIAASPPARWPAEADRLLASLAALDPNAHDGGEPGADPDRAAALADAGRTAEAIAAYARIAEARPNDRETQTAYASLLSQSGDPGQRDEALRRWRAIESRSDRQSEAWFAARLARIRLLADLGRRAEATKLLKLTRLLVPNLSGDQQRALDGIAQKLFPTKG